MAGSFLVEAIVAMEIVTQILLTAELDGVFRRVGP